MHYLGNHPKNFSETCHKVKVKNARSIAKALICAKERDFYVLVNFWDLAKNPFQ
jgi:hypothetical protein